MEGKKILKLVISILIFFDVIAIIVFLSLGKDLYVFGCILFIFILIEGYGQFNAFMSSGSDNETKSPWFGDFFI